MRFVSPAFFLIAGGWVQWSNATHTDRVVTLPLLDVFTSDLKEQGQLTATICFGLGAFFLVRDLFAVLRGRPPKGDEA